MKLVHPDLSASFTEEHINILVVENPASFREFCKGLRDGDDGGFVLSDGDKTLDLNKCGLIISDPTDILLDNKRIADKLRNEFAEIVENNYLSEYTKIVEQISALFDKVNSECSIGAEWSDGFSVGSLVKALGVTPASEDNGFLDNLITYITAYVNLLGVRFVAFVNLKSYLTESERVEFYKFLRYNGILALSVESFNLPKSDGEFIVVIDNDLCEIVV